MWEQFKFIPDRIYVNLSNDNIIDIFLINFLINSFVLWETDGSLSDLLLRHSKDLVLPE